MPLKLDSLTDLDPEILGLLFIVDPYGDAALESRVRVSKGVLTK